MNVTCAMCGYKSIIILTHQWNAHGHKAPEVWLCDQCEKKICDDSFKAYQKTISTNSPTKEPTS